MGLFVLGALGISLGSTYAFFFAGMILTSAGKVIYDPTSQAYIGDRVTLPAPGSCDGVGGNQLVGSVLAGYAGGGLVDSAWGLAGTVSVFRILRNCDGIHALSYSHRTHEI